MQIHHDYISQIIRFISKRTRRVSRCGPSCVYAYSNEIYAGVCNTRTYVCFCICVSMYIHVQLGVRNETTDSALIRILNQILRTIAFRLAIIFKRIRSIAVERIIYGTQRSASCEKICSKRKGHRDTDDDFLTIKFAIEFAFGGFHEICFRDEHK